jgi:hypothetical protein
MPTPFTHLEIAQRLLQDDLPPDVCTLLNSECSAFLLGSIAADARVESGVSRETTHFYAYDQPIVEHPWRVMMHTYPQLEDAHSPAQRAFLAGYIAHLSVDEYWTVNLVRPYFVKRDWGEFRPPFRFLMLHIILSYMDERDLVLLQSWQYETLCEAQPDEWLPFMNDATLMGWRNYIGDQIKPDGISQTLPLFGLRLGKPAEELRAILDSPEEMQRGLWTNVPQDDLARVEGEMYAFAREQMAIYLDEYPADGLT